MKTLTLRSTKVTPAQSASKDAFSRLEVYTAAVKIAVINDERLSSIRHSCTNYDKCCAYINATYSKEVANEAVHKLQNLANGRIDDVKREYTKELLAQLKNAKATISSQSNIIVELSIQIANNTVLTKEQLETIASEITSKEQYIQFIADIMDCSFEEAVEAV